MQGHSVNASGRRDLQQNKFAYNIISKWKSLSPRQRTFLTVGAQKPLDKAKVITSHDGVRVLSRKNGLINGQE